MSSSSFNQGAGMTAGSKGGFRGPDTRAPGGGGMDQFGNPIGGGMGAQFNFGGPPRAIGGPAPIGGMPPAQGDLYQPGQGSGRFQPGGMIPPAGARGQVRGSVPDPRRLGRYNPQPGFGNPRQFNPGQPPMQPGMPVERAPGLPGGIPRFGGGGKSGFQGPMERGPIQVPGPGFFDNNQNPDADAFNAISTLL